MEDDDDDNFRQNIPSTLPDHEAMGGGCVTELTRGNSDSSAITSDSSNGFLLHDVDSALGPSTVWTDERHRLYLASLEASFVNQLHHSITLRGSLQELWGSCSSALPTNSCNSSHQFMVLQDGSWPKINPEMNKPLMKSTSNSHFIQKNLPECHFKSKGKRHNAACHDQEHGAPSCQIIHAGGNSLACCGSARSTQHPAWSRCHQNSVNIAIEVSDQNFVDEHHGEKSSSMSMVKRLKIVGPGASSNDQVVPFGYSNATSSTSRPSSEREQEFQELPSENPDKFVNPKSDLNHFLRES